MTFINILGRTFVEKITFVLIEHIEFEKNILTGCQFEEPPRNPLRREVNRVRLLRQGEWTSRVLRVTK